MDEEKAAATCRSSLGNSHHVLLLGRPTCRALLEKISNPDLDIRSRARPIVETVRRLLQADTNLSGL